MSELSYWSPNKPSTFEQQVARTQAATGPISGVERTHQANYNGHHITMSYKPLAVTGATWTAHYTWCGIRYVGRGGFQECLRGALAAQERNGAGGCLVVYLTDEDPDYTLDSLIVLCVGAGLEPHSKDIQDAAYRAREATDWRFAAAAFRYQEPGWVARLLKVDPTKVTQAEFEAEIEAERAERAKAREKQAEEYRKRRANMEPRPDPYENHPFLHLAKPPYRFIEVEERVYRATPDAPAQPGGSCMHCSTGLRYLFHFTGSCGTRFHVGCDCALKAGPKEQKVASEWRRKHNRELARARKEGKRAARKAAREARKAAREAEAKAAYEAAVAEDDELRSAYEVEHHIIEDIHGKHRQWGSISEKQRAFVLKLAKEAREKVEQPEVTYAPLPTADKRHTIEGKIVAAVYKPNTYRPWDVDVLKIMVEWEHADGTSKLWGNVPRALDEAWWDSKNAHDESGAEDHHPGISDWLRGKRIRFVARVKVSDDDPTFGFINRPSKMEVLSD